MKTNSISGGLQVHARTIAITRHFIFRRTCLWAGFLAFATIAFGPQPAQAAMTEAWVQRYESEAGSADYASKVVTDAGGNVIVAGTTHHTQTGSGSDMVIIKYSGAGVPLWTNRYDGDARALAVDSSANVFVTGNSLGSGANYDYATIAYSSAGVPLWTNRYNGPGNGYDFAYAVAVDGSGNVFVTGSSYVSLHNYYDYATIAYSGAGVPLWTNRYNGAANGDDQARAVAVDGTGNVFVTGYSGYFDGFDWFTDYTTIAYSGAGVPLWTTHYNGVAKDLATAVAVDASGNVFVTGSSGASGDSYDYATIAYSGAGVELWIRRYNGPGNGRDEPTAVAVDGSGNVFVTGYSVGSGSDADYATIAYSGAGVPLWTNRYHGLANRYDAGATAVAVDGSGNVFVTGSSPGSGGDSDYATIAYSSAGVELWTNRYGGRGDASDVANAVALDGSGNLFVTGYSYGAQGYEDYATIAYSGAGVPLWTNHYNGPGNSSDQAIALAVDASGNVFVTGSSEGSGGNSDYAVIAYSGAGVPLWTNRYNGPGNSSDQAIASAVGASGNVFVTGSSTGSGGDSDYATIAYSGAGVALWTNRYNGPHNGNDGARAVAVDASGNVFVTGYSYAGLFGYDYATIAYSGAGVPLWTNLYRGSASEFAFATAVAVDASGNVFVTGSAGDGFTSHYATIAYSGAGVPLWTNRYSGSLYDSANASAVAVGGSGNVFVTGSSYEGSGVTYATIAYSGAGVALWTNRYDGSANGSDQAIALAVDASGNVFVTGSSVGSTYDYATILYSGAGVPLWTNRYNGPGNSEDRPQTKSSLAIGSDGAVYVTGASEGLSSSDFVTVKYVWQPEIAIQPLSTIPPTLNLTLSAAPNSSWAIERALEPTGPWTNLNALVIGPNGSAQFQDINPPSPAGFYRARQEQ